MGTVPRGFCGDNIDHAFTLHELAEAGRMASVFSNKTSYRYRRIKRDLQRSHGPTHWTLTTIANQFVRPLWVKLLLYSLLESGIIINLQVTLAALILFESKGKQICWSILVSLLFAFIVSLQKIVCTVSSIRRARKLKAKCLSLMKYHVTKSQLLRWYINMSCLVLGLILFAFLILYALTKAVMMW